MHRALIAALLLATPLGGCTTYPSDAPIAENGPPRPIRTFVAIGQPVYVGSDVVVTPQAVYEDSRCPTGVQCVWSGRVVVTTRIDGPGWRETVNLVSGEQQRVRGHDILLIEVLPNQHPQSGIPVGDYRFNFVMDYHP